MNARLSGLAAITSIILLFSVCSQAGAQVSRIGDLARKAGPAVVNVTSTKKMKLPDKMKDLLEKHGKGTPFEDFFDKFKDFLPEGPEGKPREQTSHGSGFIVSKDGYVVTNNHVVEDALGIDVRLRGVETPLKAEVVGRDPETDLALLKIDAGKDLPVLEFGDSEELEIGQWVVAIGNPFGLDHTVTAGIISAKGRAIGAGPYDDFIQTDASINPGNSGGPLLNMDGEVIGINTAIVAGGQGIGFAVPSAMAENIVQQLRKNKEVLRGWLGVTIQSVDENTARALDLDEPRGALVASVIPGEPADRAGIRQGDVILAVNGVRMAGSQELTRAIAGFPPGEEVLLTVWRKAREKKVTVTLGKRELQKQAEKREPEADEPGDVLGMSLSPLAEDEGEAGDSRGLAVTSVRDGSPAAQAEIREGDVILQVNQLDVAGIQDLKRAIESEWKNKEVLLFLIRRGDRNIFRTVKIGE